MNREKGIAALYILILALVGIGLIGWLVFPGQAKVEVTTQTTTTLPATSPVNELKSLDSETYTLYLPQNFEEISRKTNKGANLIQYSDPDDQYKEDAGIAFMIVPTSNLKEISGTTDKEKVCDNDFQSIRNNLQAVPGGKLDKAEKMDLQNVIVCDGIWTTPVEGKNIQDTVVTHQRKFIPKSDASKNYFILTGSYFGSHAEKFKQSIESALLKFSVK